MRLGGGISFAAEAHDRRAGSVGDSGQPAMRRRPTVSVIIPTFNRTDS